ncbi:hypothetical protein QJS66_03780 [Kocuria rhizophila]|nr:hypothetical protein QJS66_03780 [Kocuria rhizophila]
MIPNRSTWTRCSPPVPRRCRGTVCRAHCRRTSAAGGTSPAAPAGAGAPGQGGSASERTSGTGISAHRARLRLVNLTASQAEPAGSCPRRGPRSRSASWSSDPARSLHCPAAAGRRQRSGPRHAGGTAARWSRCERDVDLRLLPVALAVWASAAATMAAGWAGARRRADRHGAGPGGGPGASWPG